MKLHTIRHNHLIDNIAWIATLFLFVSFYIFNTTVWGKYILLAATVVIGFCYVLQNKWIICFKMCSYHYFILSFVALCYLSAIWAQNPSYAIEKGFTILQILICTTVLYLYYSKKESVSPLIDIVMWGGYVVTFYTIIFTGIDTIRYAMVAGERLGNTFSNINSIGMVSAIAVVIAFYKFIFVKKSLHIILTVPCVFMVAMTGSRKALALLGVGILLLLLFKYAKGNPFIVAFKLLFIGIIVVALILYLLTLPMFSVIAERMEGLVALITGVGKVDSSAQIRDNMIQLGMEIFKENPILGVGIGNARIVVAQSLLGHETYLHNNYVELLSSLGIIGFTLYYSMWGYVLLGIYKYRKYSEKLSIICITLILLQLMLDYGMVSYYSKDTYLYLMIFYLHLSLLKRRCGTDGYEKREALVLAGSRRLRPIFMTAFTTVLGLLTMALGIGTGTDMISPMAIVVIGGLLYSTLMTLFVVPIMYDILYRKKIRIVRDIDFSELDSIQD